MVFIYNQTSCKTHTLYKKTWPKHCFGHVWLQGENRQGWCEESATLGPADRIWKTESRLPERSVQTVSRKPDVDCSSDGN